MRMQDSLFVPHEAAGLPPVCAIARHAAGCPHQLAWCAWLAMCPPPPIPDTLMGVSFLPAFLICLGVLGSIDPLEALARKSQCCPSFPK